MSYVISTLAAAPMPGWASPGAPTTPVATSTSASVASSAPTAGVLGVSSVSHAVASSAGVPQMLPVESVVASESAHDGHSALTMLPVASVFTEADDGGASGGTTFSLPFTSAEGAGSDGGSDLMVADTGDASLLDGWFVA